MKLKAPLLSLLVGVILFGAFQNCGKKLGSTSTQDASSEALPSDGSGGTPDPVITPVTPTPPMAASEVRGFVDGYDIPSRTVRGWVCISKSDAQVKVNVSYPTTEGRKVYEAEANLISESAVAHNCQNKLEVGHRFSAAISTEDVAKSVDDVVVTTYASASGPVKISGNEIRATTVTRLGLSMQIVDDHPVMAIEPYPDCGRLMTFPGFSVLCGTKGMRCGKWHIFKTSVYTLECK